jgi:hypothetical protein
VVNWRYQFRVAFMAVIPVITLIILLNFILITSTVRETERAMSIAPELADFLKEQDRSQAILVLVVSLIFLFGVFLVSLFESHKTAGAAWNIRAKLDRIGRGDLKARVKLRKNDNLADLAWAINRMAAALDERNLREVEILERVLAKIGRDADLQAREEIAGLIKAKQPPVD